MRYLGIDYGKSKIGLSISEGLTASPLKVLSVNSLKDAILKVRQVVEKEGIGRVVVGLPESGEARKITEDFINNLKPYVDVVASDETLSTQNAVQKMIQLGKSKKTRRQEDAVSASLILQEYLDNL